jgi:hypothetical protein
MNKKKINDVKSAGWPKAMPFISTTSFSSSLTHLVSMRQKDGSSMREKKKLISWYESVRQEEYWIKLKKDFDSEQTQIFKNWINEIFITYSMTSANQFFSTLVVKNVYVDLNDGIRILYLLEIVYSVHLKKEDGFSKQVAQSKLHKMKNFEICIDFLQNEKNVKCHGINPIDLVEGNKKIMLGLLFLIKVNIHIQIQLRIILIKYSTQLYFIFKNKN